MLNPLIPYGAFTTFTPTLPEFYWDVYSAEQRIKHICYELCKMKAYSDYLAERINELGEDVSIELKEMQENLDKQQREFHDEIIRLIEELQVGCLQWNCQHGEFTGTVQAQRDMFNDVTVHSYNIEQLETVFNVLDMNVDELANCGLNVKGFAVVNHFLYNPHGPTSDVINNNENARQILTVNDLSETRLDLDGYLFVELNNH